MKLLQEKLIGKVQQEIDRINFQKHSNQWNIANQLIDIVVVCDEDVADIILCDLQIEDMTVEKLVKHITAKRIADPFVVAKEICKFYHISEVSTLPPEHWRLEKTPQLNTKPTLSLLDFME